MDIKRIVATLITKNKTNNPFVIADSLEITILYADMQNLLGYFSQYHRSKFIHLNNSIPENMLNFVLAHELGHAVLHPDVNTPFLKTHSIFSTSKIEKQANTFAMELLLPDKLLRKYPDTSCYTLAEILGVPMELVELKYILSKH